VGTMKNKLPFNGHNLRVRLSIDGRIYKREHIELTIRLIIDKLHYCSENFFRLLKPREWRLRLRFNNDIMVVVLKHCTTKCLKTIRQAEGRLA
jgi:hypothetical protein